MNAQYLIRLPLDELMPHLEPFLADAGLAGTHEMEVEKDRLQRAVELHRMRAKTLGELAGQVTCYFRERLEYDPEACAKFIADPELPDRLEALRDRYTQAAPFEVDCLDETLRRLADDIEVKAAYLIHPLRMALSASTGGPGAFDLVEAQGREATRRHLTRFIEWLREQQAGEGQPKAGGG
jgi:glutamyl/glutaminyl-tRNA synthetase